MSPRLRLIELGLKIAFVVVCVLAFVRWPVREPWPYAGLIMLFGSGLLAVVPGGMKLRFGVAMVSVYAAVGLAFLAVFLWRL